MAERSKCRHFPEEKRKLVYGFVKPEQAIGEDRSSGRHVCKISALRFRKFAAAVFCEF
jgi:hypothetical protein